MSDTCQRVEAICRELSGCGAKFSIHNETSLAAPIETGGLDLDSMDRVLLAMKCEEEFGIEIPDDDVDKNALGTFGGLVAYVQGKLDASPSVPARAGLAWD